MTRSEVRDEYLANPSAWPIDAIATRLNPVETRGPAIVRDGHVMWNAQPIVPCPRCETPLKRGQVTLTFRNAPRTAREQTVDAFVCPCGEFYVPGSTARAAHRRAFAVWLNEPEQRIPELEQRAHTLLGSPSSWEDSYEAAVLLKECIRLEQGRVQASSDRKEQERALMKTSGWACAARDVGTASRAWQELLAMTKPPPSLASAVMSLGREFDSAVSELWAGDEAAPQEMTSLARRFFGDARLWEHMADLQPPGPTRDDALIRAARLKGIVGIEERNPRPDGDAVPITLGGAIAVSPKAA